MGKINLSGFQIIALILGVALVASSGIYTVVRGGEDPIWVLAFATVAQVLIPVLLTLLIVPKGRDHSVVASTAVTDLYSLIRSMDALDDRFKDIKGYVIEGKPEYVNLSLAEASRDVGRQRDWVRISITKWSEVDGGAVDKVIKQKKDLSSKLMELELAEQFKDGEKNE